MQCHFPNTKTKKNRKFFSQPGHQKHEKAIDTIFLLVFDIFHRGKKIFIILIQVFSYNFFLLFVFRSFVLLIFLFFHSLLGKKNPLRKIVEFCARLTTSKTLFQGNISNKWRVGVTSIIIKAKEAKRKISIILDLKVKDWKTCISFKMENLSCKQQFWRESDVRGETCRTQQSFFSFSFNSLFINLF